MKKTKLIALLLTLLVVLSLKNSFAQNTTFKLSDYKNPNYFYQTLDLNFGLNSASSAHKNDNSSDFSNLKSYSLGSNAQANYSVYANSRKSQSEFYAYLNGSFTSNGQHNLSDLSNNDSRQSSFSNNETFAFGGLKRFYNDKQNYFEIEGSFSNSNSGNLSKYKSLNNDIITNQTKNSVRNFHSNSNVILHIGKGRIEQVQDARMALYLINDLHQLNRDKRQASDEDVLELAKLITSLKYKRFFDNRLRKIAEITAIDSFMQQKGIVSSADVTYFTSLNDNWDFANNPVRKSGWRIFTGVEGGFGYNYNKSQVEYIIPSPSTQDQTYADNRLIAFLVAGLDYEKPINLKWQNSASIEVQFGSWTTKSINKASGAADFNTYNSESPIMDVSASYGFGYYPNSRTWLTADWFLSSEYHKQFTGTLKSDKENSTNSFLIYTGPSAHAYYYLSERLRLSINFIGYLQINNDNYLTNIPEGSDNNQTKTDWNQELTASLTYSLF
jgi:hypothetical protein